MRRTSIVLAFIASLSLTALAQDSGEVGVFADFYRHSETENTNFWGLGGRVGLNVHPLVQLEVQMAYDFGRSFTEGFEDPATGVIVFQQSGFRVLHALFGPKLQTGSGPVRAFGTVKGGLVSFRFDDRPVTFGTFGSTVEELRDSDVSGVLYLGGGIEQFLGPFGLRLDVGDEIYFRSGRGHHNLRINFGPHIRF